MKKIVALLLGVFAFCSYSNATNYAGTGKVSKIRAHELGISTNWVTIEGFTSAGNCSTKDNGLVKLLVADDERADKQFSVLLAAKMAGAEVYVQADDATAPTCNLRYIDLL